ncbi:MAG: polysaccharide biosynthesis/export family protein [Paludibacter sp.]|nr:polysaccharide biosynthesis/export family protein [Paludibacter sp.]MDD4198192.1 polysaccharide biosynthesis/export family protein [Paludibacter sp.]MDD4426896.1 polysaccharide biosynthesis/export family protein [Paludibacter sp.]
MQDPNNIIPAYKDSVAYEDYRLRTGDKIFVRVYSTHEETNALFNGPYNQLLSVSMDANPQADLYSYTVQPNGSIVFPMIGEVSVAGKTAREATRTLEKAIEPLYSFSTIELRVVNRYFSIIGANRTGYYPILREKINIFQALAMAGDAGTYADRSRVRIIRETDHGTVVKVFDLRSESILNSEYYYIEPNDVIYIQKLDEQFFSILNLPSLIATTISTISFGIFMYNILFTGGSGN